MLRQGMIATLAALTIAGNAGAANKYVSPSGSATWANANSPSSPASLGTANSSAVGGDNVHMAAGSYGTGIAPANSGAAGARIVFMGPAGDSSSVVVPSINLDGDDYVTVKWLRCNGGAAVNAASNGTNNPIADSLYFCRILGSVGASGSRDFTIANCLVGRGRTSGLAFQMSRDGVFGAQTWRPVVNDCVMYLGGENAMKINRVFAADWNRSRFYMYGPSGTLVPSEWNGSVGNRISDCRFELLNHGINNAYLFYLRDSTQHNVFIRDTIWTDPASSLPSRIAFSGSGAIQGVFTQYNNQYISCVFRATGLIDAQHHVRRNRWEGCQFSWPGNNGGSPLWNVSSDSVVFRHNTVVTTGSGISWDNGSLNPLVALTFDHNLFVRQGDGTSAILVLNWSSAIGPHGVDYNLYYCTGAPGDSTLALSRNSVTSRVGPSSSFCTGAGVECHSRWANPSLSNLATFDFTPAAGSPAIGSYWPDGYVGAIAQAAGPDVTPPAAVTSLAIQQTADTTVTLRWTAPGDDGNSGWASAYELRWSTSPITAGNFASATAVSPQPLTAAAGTLQTHSVLGLLPGTTYYFALRARDEASNVSGLSNVAQATTLATDQIPPAVVTDLSVTP
jgi:hypothetical protein